MQGEHTPGAWHIGTVDRSSKEIIIFGPGAYVDFDDVDHDEQEANARLIAAAPDLLAAAEHGLSLAGGWREAIGEIEDWCSEPVRLKNMLAAIHQIDGWAAQARAAIVKAKGDTNAS
jgi:hypothetical protein